jgi:branched-chain amino acid transport system substrate-binding protein
MKRRTIRALAAAAALLPGASLAQEMIMIGASAPKTGPLAGGAAITN